MKLLKNILNIFLQKPQETLEEKTRGSEFIFDKLEHQVILLMITNDKKWNYFAVKKMSALLKGITSNIKRFIV